MLEEAFLLAKTSLFDSISQMNPTVNVPSVDSQTNVFAQAGELVNYFLGLVGLIMLALVIYAGVTILLSQGNDEKVAEARKMIIFGVAGTVLIAVAFALTSWIFGSSFFVGSTGEETSRPSSTESSSENSGNQSSEPILQVIPQNGVRLD